LHHAARPRARRHAGRTLADPLLVRKGPEVAQAIGHAKIPRLPRNCPSGLRRMIAARSGRAPRPAESEGHMRRKLTWMTMLGVMLVMTARHAPPLHATAASGFAGTTIAMGTFAEFSVFNHLLPPDFWKDRHRSDIWLSFQKTKGDSDLYIQSNTW